MRSGLNSLVADDTDGAETARIRISESSQRGVIPKAELAGWKPDS